MTKEDIIRMAREAGLLPHPENIVYQDPMFEGRIKTFARLVIAHERKRLMEDLAPSGSFVSWNNTKCNPLADPMMQSKSAWDDGYASGVAAEREACAKVCENIDEPLDPSAVGGTCAAAIRARGQE